MTAHRLSLVLTNSFQCLALLESSTQYRQSRIHCGAKSIHITGEGLLARWRTDSRSHVGA